MPPLPFAPPRQLPWPLKPLDSAQTSLGYDDRGRMVMRIRHELLFGITPAMIDWWFRNIAGDMDVAGMRISRYLVWHPLDHIHCAARIARPRRTRERRMQVPLRRGVRPQSGLLYRRDRDGDAAPLPSRQSTLTLLCLSGSQEAGPGCGTMWRRCPRGAHAAGATFGRRGVDDGAVGFRNRINAECRRCRTSGPARGRSPAGSRPDAPRTRPRNGRSDRRRAASHPTPCPVRTPESSCVRSSDRPGVS